MGTAQSEAERKVRASLRKAFDAHQQNPSAAKWARVLKLDAQLRDLRGQEAGQ